MRDYYQLIRVLSRKPVVLLECEHGRKATNKVS